jgi:hypothetical protein
MGFLTEGLIAAVGLLIIAYKVVRDDNVDLRAQLEELRTQLDLQPLNDKLAQANKEMDNAKNAYNSALDKQ